MLSNGGLSRGGLSRETTCKSTNRYVPPGSVDHSWLFPACVVMIAQQPENMNSALTGFLGEHGRRALTSSPMSRSNRRRRGSTKSLLRKRRER